MTLIPAMMIATSPESITTGLNALVLTTNSVASRRQSQCSLSSELCLIGRTTKVRHSLPLKIYEYTKRLNGRMLSSTALFGLFRARRGIQSAFRPVWRAVGRDAHTTESVATATQRRTSDSPATHQRPAKAGGSNALSCPMPPTLATRIGRKGGAVL